MICCHYNKNVLSPKLCYNSMCSFVFTPGFFDLIASHKCFVFLLKSFQGVEFFVRVRICSRYTETTPCVIGRTHSQSNIHSVYLLSIVFVNAIYCCYHHHHTYQLSTKYCVALSINYLLSAKVRNIHMWFMLLKALKRAVHCYLLKMAK